MNNRCDSVVEGGSPHWDSVGPKLYRHMPQFQAVQVEKVKHNLLPLL